MDRTSKNVNNIVTPGTTYEPEVSLMYVRSNVNIVMSRWLVLLLILMGTSDAIISFKLLGFTLFLVAVSLVQYWLNCDGHRMLITDKTDYEHSQHYRKFLRAHNIA